MKLRLEKRPVIRELASEHQEKEREKERCSTEKTIS